MLASLLRAVAVLAAMGAAAAQTPGLAHITPTPTNFQTGLQLGFLAQTPAPTPTAPEGDLKRRQNVQTCAFLGGNPAAPLYCSPGLQCTANTQLDQAGCCPPNQACAVATACVPYMSMGFCDGSCFNDPVMIKCFNPTFPDCVTITMHVDAGTAMYYDCGVAGLGGAYAAQWAPTQGASPQPTAQGAGTPSVTMSVGGANNQGVGGNGANVNGNGNTVIYNSGAGRIWTGSAALVGGTWALVVAALLW